MSQVNRKSYPRTIIDPSQKNSPMREDVNNLMKMHSASIGNGYLSGNDAIVIGQVARQQGGFVNSASMNEDHLLNGGVVYNSSMSTELPVIHNGLPRNVRGHDHSHPNKGVCSKCRVNFVNSGETNELTIKSMDNNSLCDTTDEFCTYGTKFAVVSKINSDAMAMNGGMNMNAAGGAAVRINGNQDGMENINGVVDGSMERVAAARVVDVVSEEGRKEKNRRTVTTDYLYDNSEDSDEFEEIIEEEVRTIRKTEPVISQPVREQPVSQAPDTGPMYSEEYMMQLEESIIRKYLDSLPDKRDFSLQLNIDTTEASTMAAPPSPPPRRCFGVSTKPVSNSVGVSTQQDKTFRDVGCLFIESDEEMHEWFQQRIGQFSAADQGLMLELARLFKNDREQFILLLSRILCKSVCSQGTSCAIDTDSKLTNTLPLEPQSVGVEADMIIEPEKVIMESMGISARPEMKNINSMTEQVKLRDVQCLTEPPMVRSQACMAQQEAAPSVDHGVNTDTLSSYSSKATETVTNSVGATIQTPREFLAEFVDSAALSQAEELMRKHKDDYQSKLISAAIMTEAPFTRSCGICTDNSTVSCQVDATDPSLMEDIINGQVESRLKLMSGNKIGGFSQTQTIVPVNTEIHVSSYGAMQDSATGGSFQQTEDSATAAENIRKKRMLLESWEATTEYDGGNAERQQNMNIMSSRSHGSFSNGGNTRISNVVNEIPARIDVTQESAISSEVTRVPSSRRRMISPSNISETQIISMPDNNIPTTKVERVRDQRTSLSKSEVTYQEFPYNAAQNESGTIYVSEQGGNYPQQMSGTSRLRFEMGTNMQANREDMSSVQYSIKIPSRNNSFMMSESVRMAASEMSEWFRTHPNSSLTEEMISVINVITSVWFDLCKSNVTDINITKDFIAQIYSYSPKLLEYILNSQDQNGSSALHYAIGHGLFNLTKVLLDTRMVSVNAFNEAGYTPFMIAVLSKPQTSEDLRVVDEIFSNSNLDQRSKADHRQTALILAARNNAADIVDLLLMHRVSVNKQDDKGNNALMYAAENGSEDVVRHLLEEPSLNVNQKNRDGMDALSIAKSRDFQKIANLIERRIYKDSGILSYAPDSLSKIFLTSVSKEFKSNSASDQCEYWKSSFSRSVLHLLPTHEHQESWKSTSERSNHVAAF